ncbi:T9SS type A sorting domain-containing protein [Nostoc sp. NIES-2111]
MLKRLTLGLAACLATLAPTLAQTVGRAEYFFDTDPGVGAANALTYTTPGDSSDQVFTLPISTLSQGFHQLGVRVKAGNKWGPAFSRVFYKLAVSTGTVATPVSKAEYFVDVDPGVGLGTAIAVSTSGDSVQLSPAIPVASLSSGFHLLAVRFRNSQGHWGEAITRVFYKLGTGINNPLSGRPARGEYYFDTDPGVGAGRPLAAFSRADSVSLLATIPVTGLGQGFHTLGLRLTDSVGHWSEANTRIFYVAPRVGQPLGVAPGLARAEFYFDVDPGNGNGRRVSNFVPGEIVDFTSFLSARSLSGGYHTVYARVADSAGTWSVPMSKSFLVNAPGVQKCVPSEGGNIGQVTLAITGFGFTDSTRMKLISRRGGPDLVPPDSLVSQVDGQTLYATLDLKNRDTGYYDVQVTFRGRRDSTITLARGFRIVPGVLPDVSAEIIGYQQMRNHNWIPFTLVVQNKGNVDAKAVPVFVVVPANATVRWHNIKPFQQGYTQSALDSIGRDFRGFIVDSALGSPRVKQGKMYGFILPQLQAGETRVIGFEVYTSPPFEFTYEFRAWALPPMTGPSLIRPDGRPQELGCLNFATDPCHKAALDVALQLADQALAAAAGPLGGCAYTVLTTKICSAVNVVKNARNGDDVVGNLAVDFASGWAQTLFDCIDPSVLARKYATVFKAAKVAYDLYQKFAFGQALGGALADCWPPLKPANQDDHNSTVVSAIDPNEKLGATGVGRGRFITTGSAMRYVIRFENLETASAPAQTVTIRDTLDRTVFDPSTIELGFVGFGDTLSIPPRGLKQWQTEVGLFPFKPYTVRVTARYSDTTGILTWYFQTLNPATLTPINNPAGGFLPPNVYPPQGQGAVFFSINTRPNIPTNTVIRNRASIIFDQNPQILTSAWINTADATPPVSAVQGLPPGSPTRFGVVWGGTDVGSGVMNYTVYVRTNNGPYRIWKGNTDSTYGVFTGILDSTYAFYSVARDSALNLEQPPAVPDAVTIISGLDKQEVVTGLRIGVVPNPNNGSFTLTILGLKSKAELSVLDMSGRPVLMRELDADTQSRSIHLPDVVKGLYMVRVRSNQGTVLRRMVVE